MPHTTEMAKLFCQRIRTSPFSKTLNLQNYTTYENLTYGLNLSAILQSSVTMMTILMFECQGHKF